VSSYSRNIKYHQIAAGDLLVFILPGISSYEHVSALILCVSDSTVKYIEIRKSIARILQYDKDPGIGFDQLYWLRIRSKPNEKIL